MAADRAQLETVKRWRSTWFKLGLVALVLVIAVVIIVKVTEMNTPPDSVYSQAEAYAPMEAAAADAVAVLPDFPGFEQRSWGEMPCSHNGVDDPDYTNIEIRYRMSGESSTEDRVRGEYVDLLREHWSSLGYQITYEAESERADGGTARDIAVKREDGITLWYSVAGYASLMIQSGCVPVSDPADIPYVPPAGGIEPGGEGDKLRNYFPDGVPTDATSDEAIAPFGEDQAAPLPFSSPGSFEGLL